MSIWVVLKGLTYEESIPHNGNLLRWGRPCRAFWEWEEEETPYSLFSCILTGLFLLQHWVCGLHELHSKEFSTFGSVFYLISPQMGM